MDVERGHFMNVRDAARALEVHENTIRNWVKEGRLADARLPGSRFIRVERSAVERLRDQRGRDVPSLKAERLNANPELASAGQLRRWALDRSRDAQQRLPEMVRRLLVESPGISGVSVRSGDGISLPGWDGLADSDGRAAYLPAGQLRFEIGVDKAPHSKAESDYAKRATEQPAGKVFVFVTPHRWAGKEDWASEKRAERRFSDVRVLDADDIEGWLKTSPATHYWISEHLGLSPRHAQTLEARWSRFSAAHQPALPVGLFIAGRVAQVEMLRSRLTAGAAQLTTIQAEWVDDCLGFLYGAVTAASEQRPRVDVPILLVDTEVAWDRIVNQAGQAILVPTFEGADVGRALDRHHHVISLVDKTVASRRTIDIALPRPNRPAASAALEATGLDFRQAQQMAALARRSMPAMARRLSRNPTFTRPKWATAPDALVYALLVLTGAWKSEATDREALELLTGVELVHIDRLVESATGTTDPLFRRTASTIMVASPEEAFSLVRESLRARSLQMWLKAATAVLLDPDPALDLPADERHLAGISGPKRRYSTTLTRGVAQGFALLGTMSDGTVLEDQRTASEATSHAVRELLSSAISDRTGRQLHILAPSLPLLAEAAPNEFLRAISDSLDDPAPVVLSLFQEVEDGLALGPSSPHPHLLWALETLCWSQEHLVETVRVLARLAAREPGGKSGNRPSSSLASVLTGWVRHTSADLATRITALDAVFSAEEAVGWRLLKDLWPERNAWAMPPAAPRFRENWAPAEAAVPIREWVDFVSELVNRAIAHSGASADHLPQFVSMASTVPAEDRDRMIAHLEAVAASSELDQEARSRLWEQLKKTVARHRQFSTAAWAMDSQTVDRLAMLTDSIEPTSDPSRLAYLFDWHPELLGVDLSDFDTYQLRLQQARAEAMRQILERDDWSHTLAVVARRAKAPSQLGWSIADADQVTAVDLIPWIAGDEPALRDVALHVFQRRIEAGGPKYLEGLLSLQEVQGEARARILRAVPPAQLFWDVLRRSPDQDDFDRYWQTAAFEAVPVLDSAEAIAQLTARGRAWVAIAVGSYALAERAREPSYTESDGVTTTCVVDLLNAALSQPPSDGELGQMTSHYVGELLDFLKAAHVDDSVVARYEFSFFRLLEHSREPVTLRRFLASDAQFFVDLVKLAFRAKNEPRRDRSAAESELAMHAYTVLNGWNGYPGRKEDGQVDPDLLEDWVVRARLLLSESGRADIGDEVIGESFAYCPVGEDGVWPPEAVRDMIERIGSQELENGFLIGRLNSRGVTSRGVYDGGQQERVLAAQYRDWSTVTAMKWPRTARILRAIADDYERDARRQDAKAELDADQD
jgi:excisionase family DNA binding protein